MAIEIIKKLLELFGAPSIAGYYNTRQEPVRPYVGATLFPSSEVVGRELKYVKGRAGVPIALRASALDANAPLRDRIPMYLVKHNMPFFREASQLNEELLMELTVVLQVSDAYAEPVIRRVYDDRYHFILSADVAAERLRMYLLSHGLINILDAKDNVPIVADYGFDAAKQSVTLTGTAAWNQHETAQPLTDLETGMQAVGLDSARAMMTLATYNQMKLSAQLKGAMFVGTGAPTIVTGGQVDQYLESNYKVRPLILTPRQNQYRFAWDDEGTRRQFFPDGVVSLIPDGTALGETVYGSTPEGLTSDMEGAETEIVNTGVAIRTYVTPHTVNMNTVVSQTVLPSFPDIDSLYIINAYTA